ncbi:hypothetical protein BDR26DRAFT_1016274 [Obelidium mucronatum]|nr:hypothetical protein BDR26DRAFT_1016274 [Obelidium mucronatum]
MDKTRNKRKRVKKSASTAAHQMLKRQKHMSEQGLSRADYRTKGQEFVYSLNTDGVEELVAGRTPCRTSAFSPQYFDARQRSRRAATCESSTCAWTGVADGIKDPHYPADCSEKRNVLFLACSNNGDFKFHLDSKNSTFGINFSVVVDEEDAEPPVVWPALYLPDRNVVIPAVHGEAIVSMFKHEKYGTRMWHSGERRFAEAAELVAEVDTRKRRISLILADGMGTASWAVKHNQDRFVGSAVVEKRGVTFNINRDATDRNRKIRESVLQALESATTRTDCPSSSLKNGLWKQAPYKTLDDKKTIFILWSDLREVTKELCPDLHQRVMETKGSPKELVEEATEALDKMLRFGFIYTSTPTTH